MTKIICSNMVFDLTAQGVNSVPCVLVCPTQMSIPPKAFLSTSFVQNLHFACSTQYFKSFAAKQLRCTKNIRNLYEMANKEPTSSADIRELAKQLRALADSYDAQAARMDAEKLKRIDFALGTLQTAVIKRVNSNVNNLTSRINDSIHAKKQIKRRDAALKAPAKRDAE